MSAVSESLKAVRRRIAEACERSGRKVDEVSLVAVSKTVPTPLILEAHRAGQGVFGESRQQEAAPKVATLPEAIEWHFIGKLQRNKVRKVLADFTCIHGVDSLKLAEAVNRVAGELGARPKVFLEVNLAGEPSKGGFSTDEFLGCIGEVAALPQLELMGLMVIPPEENARDWFAKARELKSRAESECGRPLPGLSMGMSGDYELAIEEGSTLVRVGSAIFGKRSEAG